MTREEAISEIKNILEEATETENAVCYVTSEDAEALTMAIEALSREQRKYDAICDELLELKSDLNLPIEVAMAYEKSIGVVRKYAKMGGLK